MNNQHYNRPPLPTPPLRRGDFVEHVDMSCLGTVVAVDIGARVAVILWTRYGLRTEPVTRLRVIKRRSHAPIETEIETSSTPGII